MKSCKRFDKGGVASAMPRRGGLLRGFLVFCAWMAACMTCGAAQTMSVVSFTASEPDEKGSVQLNWVVNGPSSSYGTIRFNVAVSRSEENDLMNSTILFGGYNMTQYGVSGSLVDTPPVAGKTYYYWLNCAPYSSSANNNFSMLWINGYDDRIHSTLSSGPITVYIPAPDIQKVTVTFHSNDGKNAVVEQEFEAGVSQNLAKNSFLRDGREFLGWSSAADGHVEYEDEQLIATDKDLSLFAVWGFSPPSNLSATQYENQHPKGVKVTWSPVEGAPGYVVGRKLEGEESPKVFDFVSGTEYLDEVSKIDGCRHLRANYWVRVVDANYNSLSRWSNPAFGCWLEKDYPAIAQLEPVSRPLLACGKEEKIVHKDYDYNDWNQVRVVFSGYDKSRFTLKAIHLNATHAKSGLSLNFPKDSELKDAVLTSYVKFNLPAGAHGRWNFTCTAVFDDSYTGSEYITAPCFLDNEPVYFLRTHCDGVNDPKDKAKDGIQVSNVNDPKGEAKDGIQVPNWFKYWLKDGALDLLDDPRLFYAQPRNDKYREAGALTYPNGVIELFMNAVTENFGIGITVNGSTVNLQTKGLSPLKRCAEVIKHELGHRDLFETRGGMSHTDVRWQRQKKDERDHDGLPTSLENGFVETYPKMRFDPNNNDSFNVYSELVKQGYAKDECDEEVYVRYLATYDLKQPKFDFGKVVHPENDYSWEPGELYGSKGRSAALRTAATPRSDMEGASYDSGSLNDIELVGGSADAEYADENIEVNAVASISPIPSSVSGKYERLDVTVICTATEEDYCTIIAALSDESGEPVAWASRTGTIASGENSYTLSFDADTLFSSKKNGYTVSRIVAARGPNLCPASMVVTSFSTSVACRWSDFASEKIEIQAIELSDAGKHISAIAEVLVPGEGGRYDVSAAICDAVTCAHVAEMSTTNVFLHSGTNVVTLAFDNGDIQRNAVNNAFAIEKFTISKEGGLLAAFSGEAAISDVDSSILIPSGAALALDAESVASELVLAEDGVSYSGVNFDIYIFNSHTNTVDYSLLAYLYSTNSVTVGAATFDVSLASGENHITIPFPGDKIQELGVDGPYVLSPIWLVSKDKTKPDQTLRPHAVTPECLAGDFAVNPFGSLVGVSRMQNNDESIVVKVLFEATRMVSGKATATLFDAEGRVVTFGHGDFDVDGPAAGSALVAFPLSDVDSFAHPMPLRVGYVSIESHDGFHVRNDDDPGVLEVSSIHPASAMPNLPATPTNDDVSTAVESAGFEDTDVALAIGGSVEEYYAFREWARGVKDVDGRVVAGEAAVIANEHAANAYLLGSERLFFNSPVVEFTEVSATEEISDADCCSLSLTVVVKDGADAVVVSSDKVKRLFEATCDLSDWSGGRLQTIVRDLTQGADDSLHFVVKPSDGTSGRAFLRIRKVIGQ